MGDGDLNMACATEHVAAEAKVNEPFALEQQNVNFGAEMLEGIRNLSGVLQRSFEDIGDNFKVMWHDMSTSFAEMRCDNQAAGIVFHPVWVGHIYFCLRQWVKIRFPRGAGSVLDVGSGPKDEFFDKYNQACKRQEMNGPAFPEDLAAFVNFENPVGEMKMKAIME